MPRPGRSFAGAWASACAVALLAAGPGDAGEGAFDPTPWIEDLQQIRAAMTQKYANFEWAVFERRIPLAGLFDATERRLRAAGSDEAARQIIDLSLGAIGDGHLGVKWPGLTAAGPPHDPQSSPGICRDLGYDAMLRGEPAAARIPHYRPLPEGTSAEFPAGQVRSGTDLVGVLRIGMFAPHGYPELCASAREALGIADHAACDDACAERLEGAVYELMSQDVARRIRQLGRAGSTVLLIDVTGNGGGSEWAEAAARMVSSLQLRSERREGVRGEHWVTYWASLAKNLRAAAQAAPAGDAKQLEEWARQVDQARTEAATPCSAAAFWSGQRPPCKWLAPAFYASGILAEADSASLHAKPWGALVFSPAQYDFEASVWHGPLLVLVDAGTASAAEEFSAVLQDNRAAVVVGARTFGAGCGHTRGGTPTVLTHSLGVLQLPDCASIRADGSNEVRGISPEVPMVLPLPGEIRDGGWKVEAELARAVDASLRLCEQAHCRGDDRPAR
jgi:hypothetical protein